MPYRTAAARESEYIPETRDEVPDLETRALPEVDERYEAWAGTALKHIETSTSAVEEMTKDARSRLRIGKMGEHMVGIIRENLVVQKEYLERLKDSLLHYSEGPIRDKALAEVARALEKAIAGIEEIDMKNAGVTIKEYYQQVDEERDPPFAERSSAKKLDTDLEGSKNLWAPAKKKPGRISRFFSSIFG